MESDEWGIECWLHESSVVDGDGGLYVCEGGRYNTENDQHQSKIQGLKFKRNSESTFERISSHIARIQVFCRSLCIISKLSGSINVRLS
jgi:hypothetical protein